MEYVFDILRREAGGGAPYHQRIRFETEDSNETVATALTQINNSAGYLDEEGKSVSYIKWEAGCLQKRCGACAMVINGTPALACDSFLKDLASGKRTKSGAGCSVITLEPLSKFPVIADLLVDRRILQDNLKTLKVWSGESGEVKEKDLDRAYDAALCLQCGCCLEACPNFYPGGKFFSAAGFAPQARLISSLTKEEREDIRKIYSEHIYEGCGKSLACAKVCPAGLDLDRLLSRSNAIEIWKR